MGAGGVLEAGGYVDTPDGGKAAGGASKGLENEMCVFPNKCDAPSCGNGAVVPVASLYVPGTPRPKQSGRFVRGRFVSQATADRGIRLYRERAERMAAEAMEAQGGAAAVAERVRAAGGTAGLWLRVQWVFATEDQTRWGAPHTSRPDVDNLLKLLMDALSKGGWFKGWKGDDAAVAKPEVVKVWGQTAGTGVELLAMTVERSAKRDAPSCAEDIPAVGWFDPGDGVPEWVGEAARQGG